MDSKKIESESRQAGTNAFLPADTGFPMKKTPKLLFVIILLLTIDSSYAQKRIGFAYYDLDRLYDTIPSLFYNDTDYTPDGHLHWNHERYRVKVELVAKTIVRMEMPLVGLYGVENEAVVKDLVQASSLPYSYIHRTLNSLDGMDFALLYYGDRFFPERIEEGYGYLCIEGTMDDNPLAILLTRGNRFAAELIEEIRDRTPNVRILCAGKLPAHAANDLQLQDALAQAENQGRGNAYSQRGWWLHDRILTDRSFSILRADIFARRDMLDPHSGAPRPVYYRKSYAGGSGHYFPIFLYIK